MAGRVWVLVVSALVFAPVALADEPKPVPDIDAWATFDLEKAFRAEPTKGKDREAVVKDAKQLFALIHPDAKADEKAVRQVEQEVEKLLGVRHLDWDKHMLIAYRGGFGRFRAEGRLDLRW